MYLSKAKLSSDLYGITEGEYYHLSVDRWGDFWIEKNDLKFPEYLPNPWDKFYWIGSIDLTTGRRLVQPYVDPKQKRKANRKRRINKLKQWWRKQVANTRIDGEEIFVFLFIAFGIGSTVGVIIEGLI